MPGKRIDCKVCGPQGSGCENCAKCIVCNEFFYQKRGHAHTKCQKCRTLCADQQSESMLVRNAQNLAEEESRKRRDADKKYAELHKKIAANRATIADLQFRLKAAQQTHGQHSDANAQVSRMEMQKTIAELQHSLRMAQQTLKQQADAHAQELRNRDSLECQLRAEIYDAKSQASIMTLIAIAIMCLFLGLALK